MAEQPALQRDGRSQVGSRFGNGLPIDTDSDVIPDYQEDANGNGAFDSGETNWQASDSDGDGVSDGLELLLGRNPLVAGTTNDFDGSLNLRVFTPLR